MAYCGPRGIPLSEFLAWPEPDQDAAIAWQAREASRCPSCGTPEGDWVDSPDAYHAHMKTCLGCLSVAAARKDPRSERDGVVVAIGRGHKTDCRCSG